MKTPTDELESPYLDSELFQSEVEPNQEVGLAALAAASPFVDPFKERPTPVVVPGIYEEETNESEAEGDALDEGEIIGTDDARVHVRDTRVVPNRWICAIDVKAKDAGGARGSGVLIGPRHVLTAAHVMRAGDVWDAKFSPARNGDNTNHPFGCFGLKLVRYALPYWVKVQRTINGKVVPWQVKQWDDYALVTLDSDLPAQLGFWGRDPAQAQVRALTTRVLKGREVTVTGYPGDRCGTTPITGSNKEQKVRRMGECLWRRPDEWASTQWQASGTALASDMRPLVFYDADTYRGQSGGPVSLVMGGVHVCTSIHVDGTPKQNWGVRVTPRMLEDLRTWINDDAGTEIARVVGDALVFSITTRSAPMPRPVERRIALEIPYRWVCHLEVYDNDLKRNVGYGTGLLISDRHVLTAARVIQDFFKDRRRYSVQITPGYEFGKEAFSSTTASKARVSPKFLPEANDASADYGLLTLSRALGRVIYPSIANVALGSWGGSYHGLSTTTADWRGRVAHIAAFSRSSGGGGGYHKLRISSGGIVGLQRGQILHKAGSRLDAPGAPIWIETGGRRVLLGITSPIFSKDSDVNWGCYLGQEMLSHLRQWVNEDFERKELEAGEQFSQDELESLPSSPDDEAEDHPAETYPDPELQDEFPEAESSAGLFGDVDVERVTWPATDSYAATEGDLEAAIEVESQTDHFLDASEFTETPSTQQDNFRAHRKEYAEDYETKDAGVEGQVSADAG